MTAGGVEPPGLAARGDVEDLFQMKWQINQGGTP